MTLYPQPFESELHAPTVEPCDLSDFPSEAAQSEHYADTSSRARAAVNSGAQEAMEEVRSLQSTVQELRAIAAELSHTFQSLQDSSRTAGARHHEIESGLTRVCSLIETRLAQLNDASQLATHTQRMLERAERLSMETSQQFAEAAAARDLLRRALERADTRRVIDVPGDLAMSTDDVQTVRLKFRGRVDAIPCVIATTRRTSERPMYRRAGVASLALFLVAGYLSVRPEGNTNVSEAPLSPSQPLSLVVTGPPLVRIPEPITLDIASQAPVEVSPSRLPRAQAPAARPAFTGTLEIQSSPQGAAVYIDHQQVGTTPLSAVHLRAGSRLVWIEHPAYQRWTGAVHVPAGKVTNVMASLQLQH